MPAVSESMEIIASKRLRMLRLAHGYTQKQIARHIHKTRSAYAYYEAGKVAPGFRTLLQLAKLYQVSIEYLIGITAESESSSVPP